MKETYELRVVERHANRIFADTEGQRLGHDFIRKIVLRADDPRVEEVERVHRELTATGDALFLGWHVHRSYSPKELDAAELLQLQITSWFEPAGEECGTVYDESRACSTCGSGAIKTTPLILKTGKLPRRDVACSIGREVVLSARVREALVKQGVSGADFADVYTPRPLRPSTTWFEPVIVSASADMDSQTGFGTPFEEAAATDRCAKGDLIGLNLLTEIFVTKTSLSDSADIRCTRQFVGVRRGLLRPARVILISQKVRRVLSDLGATGYKLQVAHVVS